MDRSTGAMGVDARVDAMGDGSRTTGPVPMADDRSVDDRSVEDDRVDRSRRSARSRSMRADRRDRRVDRIAIVIVVCKRGGGSRDVVGPDRGSTTPLGSTTTRREDRGGWSREGGMDERCVEGGRSWTRSVGEGGRGDARERETRRGIGDARDARRRDA